jgi:hypothetical protein
MTRIQSKIREKQLFKLKLYSYKKSIQGKGKKGNLIHKT